jgi:hypothetical protein
MCVVLPSDSPSALKCSEMCHLCSVCCMSRAREYCSATGIHILESSTPGGQLSDMLQLRQHAMNCAHSDNCVNMQGTLFILTKQENKIDDLMVAVRDQDDDRVMSAIKKLEGASPVSAPARDDLIV